MIVGYRTLKTAIGAGCSIWVAQLLGLKFFAAAGIITVLCVKPTKKQSLKSAGERIAACLIGLIIAGCIFEMIGYHPWSFSLVLLVLIPVCVRFKIAEGIVSSFVLVLHLYLLKTINLTIVLNELALVLIGVGFALILNLYMPSVDRELRTYQIQIEQNFKRIFTELAIYLRSGKNDWDGKEIIETTELLQKAKRLALIDIENHLKKEQNSYYTYFSMRERQFDILVRLIPIISALDSTHWQGKMIADFLDDVRDGIHPGDTTSTYFDQIKQIRDRLRKAPLPKDHEEFEIQASLFHLLNEMERYLFIKRRFHAID